MKERIVESEKEKELYELSPNNFKMKVFYEALKGFSFDQTFSAFVESTETHNRIFAQLFTFLNYTSRQSLYHSIEALITIIKFSPALLVFRTVENWYDEHLSVAIRALKIFSFLEKVLVSFSAKLTAF